MIHDVKLSDIFCQFFWGKKKTFFIVQKQFWPMIDQTSAHYWHWYRSCLSMRICSRGDKKMIYFWKSLAGLPKTNYQIVNKTCINIGNGQKFKLYLFFDRLKELTPFSPTYWNYLSAKSGWLFQYQLGGLCCYRMGQGPLGSSGSIPSYHETNWNEHGGPSYLSS